MTEKLKKKCAIIIISNLMCVICCIPLVTAGASIMALYSIMIRIARDDDKDFNIFAVFITSFRKNLRRSLLPWCTFLVLMVIMVWDVFLCRRMDGWVSNMRYPVYVLMAILVELSAYLCPLMAQFDGKLKKLLLNCLFFIISSPVKAIAIFLIHAIPGYFIIFDARLRLAMIIVWAIAGLTLTVYFTALMLQPEFDKLIKK